MEGWKQRSCKSSSSSKQVVVQVAGAAAPFVAKTYEMVSDPRTDWLIRWGRDNNTFFILDPPRFSLILLPSYFKHSNFSSFVRQLNTYGFRKVDPDRWEFAHESFLRGQTHLLPLIIRRKKKTNGQDNNDNRKQEDDHDDDISNTTELLVQEVGDLRREQRAMEEELQGMNKRLQITEKKPHQMISFLLKLAEDPELLPRLVLSKKQQQQQQQQQQQLEQLLLSHDSLPPPPQPFDTCTQFAQDYSSMDNVEFIQSTNAYVSDVSIDHMSSGSQVVLLPELGEPEPQTNTVAYPFSLLGHVFF